MSISTIFLIVGVLMLAAFFGRRFLSRSRVGKCYLMVYDSRVLRVELVKLVPEGVESIATKKVYPASELLVTQMEDGTRFYLFGADHVALSEHEALEAARLVMLPRMLFEAGGDMKRFLEYAALILPLAATIWLTLQIGSFQGSMNRMDASLQTLQKSVDTPKVMVPVAPQATEVPK